MCEINLFLKKHMMNCPIWKRLWSPWGSRVSVFGFPWTFVEASWTIALNAGNKIHRITKETIYIEKNSIHVLKGICGPLKKRITQCYVLESHITTWHGLPHLYSPQKFRLLLLLVWWLLKPAPVHPFQINWALHLSSGCYLYLLGTLPLQSVGESHSIITHLLHVNYKANI